MGGSLYTSPTDTFLRITRFFHLADAASISAETHPSCGGDIAEFPPVRDPFPGRAMALRVNSVPLWRANSFAVRITPRTRHRVYLTGMRSTSIVLPSEFFFDDLIPSLNESC